MDTRDIGRVGEFFVMYTLEKYGIECHHVDRSGIDLWCRSVDGELFTVQVKASNPRVSKDRHTPTYKFNLLGEKIADIYVFVALDMERMIVKSREALSNNKTRAGMSHIRFTEAAHETGIRYLQNYKTIKTHLLLPNPPHI
jgi:hypothetical protein